MVIVCRKLGKVTNEWSMDRYYRNLIHLEHADLKKYKTGENIRLWSIHQCKLRETSLRKGDKFMKHFHRHMSIPRRHIRRARVRPIRRRGRMLGVIGLAALGYTLLEKNRQKQMRMNSNEFVDWEDETS